MRIEDNVSKILSWVLQKLKVLQKYSNRKKYNKRAW